jgi:iron-sulfur cluster assembly protein
MNDTTQETQEITITEAAIAALHDVRTQNEIPDNYVLRIGVKGGCSGMKYAIGFDEEIQETDEVLDIGGMKVAVDPNSMYYLLGASLDYVRNEQGEGFAFNNPNEKGGCSCGSAEGSSGGGCC